MLHKYLKLAKELKTNMEHEVNGGTSYNWFVWNNPQELSELTERLRNHTTSRNHPDSSIIKSH